MDSILNYTLGLIRNMSENHGHWDRYIDVVVFESYDKFIQHFCDEELCIGDICHGSWYENSLMCYAILSTRLQSFTSVCISCTADQGDVARMFNKFTVGDVRPFGLTPLDYTHVNHNSMLQRYMDYISFMCQQ